MCSPDVTKLLISVRDVAESAIALAAGVDWIDLKEPRTGSLGQPTLETATAVAALLRRHPQRSIALGELGDLDFQLAGKFAELFPNLKVGLSGLSRKLCDPANPAPSWQHRFESLAKHLGQRGAHLIPVGYADYSLCDAPSLSEVCEVAFQIRASYMLIDTFTKDGRGLLDWIKLDELRQISKTARGFGCRMVLAGSLKFADAPQLLTLAPAALAVRGAVCCDLDPADLEPNAAGVDPRGSRPTPSRITPIDPAKVDRWCKLIAQSQA